MLMGQQLSTYGPSTHGNPLGYNCRRSQARRPEKHVTARSKLPHQKWTGLRLPMRNSRHWPSLLGMQADSKLRFAFQCRRRLDTDALGFLHPGREVLQVG